METHDEERMQRKISDFGYLTFCFVLLFAFFLPITHTTVFRFIITVVLGFVLIFAAFRSIWDMYI